MSSYINFYLKVDKTSRRIDNTQTSSDMFVPIGDFSRSNYLYQTFNSDVPYEKICPISKRTLESSIKDIYCSIDKSKEQIKKLQAKIDKIPTYNNPILDKEKLIEEYQSQIEEIKEDIEDELFAVGIINSYICMIEAIEYDNILKIDKDKYIYAGIEVPQNITDGIILNEPI